MSSDVLASPYFGSQISEPLTPARDKSSMHSVNTSATPKSAWRHPSSRTGVRGGLTVPSEFLIRPHFLEVDWSASLSYFNFRFAHHPFGGFLSHGTKFFDAVRNLAGATLHSLDAASVDDPT